MKLRHNETNSFKDEQKKFDVATFSEDDFEFRMIRRRDMKHFLDWSEHSDIRFSHYTFTNYKMSDMHFWYSVKQNFFVRKVYGLFYSDIPIAFITLKNIKKKYAEMGVGINPKYISNGISQILFKKYFEEIFHNYSFNKIGISVALFNTRAIRAYKKFGFFPEGSPQSLPFENQSNSFQLKLMYPSDFYFEKDVLVTNFQKMNYKKDTVTLKAFAKINLQLEVVGRFENGYHDLVMIMAQTNLFDTVSVRKSDDVSKIFIEKDKFITTEIPADERNIAMKALRLMQREYAINNEYEIQIVKRIPSEAGLGGGSADAAAVLKAINILENLNLESEKLEELGKLLGADVPFCVRGGVAKVRGIGEKIENIDNIPDTHLILLCPFVGASTSEIFGKLEGIAPLQEAEKRLDHNISCLKYGKISEMVLKNDLEKPAFAALPELKRYKEMLENAGLKVMMSGSGSSLIGLSDGGLDDIDISDIIEYSTKMYTIYKIKIGGDYETTITRL